LPTTCFTVNFSHLFSSILILIPTAAETVPQDEMVKKSEVSKAVPVLFLTEHTRYEGILGE
jgi:hypothetical protein